MPLVGGVGGLVTVALPWYHHPNGRLPGFHDPRLHWRGVGPQQHWLLAVLVLVVDPQSVPHVPGRMPLGDVEHLKVVAVQLYFRALHHSESHADERRANLAHDLGCRMQASSGWGTARQRDVEIRPSRRQLQSDILYLVGPLRKFLFQLLFRLIGQRADFAALL